jgi:hypothetical protein
MNVEDAGLVLSGAAETFTFHQLSVGKILDGRP